MTGDTEATAQRSPLDAVGEVLRSINRSTFDLTAILQTVVDNAVQICHAHQGNIVRQERDVYRVAAYAGMVAPEYTEMEMRREYRPERGSVIGRAVLERRIVHLPDVLADPEYALRDDAAEAGYRSMVGVPMLRDDAVIGVMALWRLEVDPFTAEELQLLSTFAEQAALAIGQATVLGETRDALERETAVSEVLATIARSRFDLNAVLQTVVESAARLTGADDGLLRAEDQGFQVMAFTANLPESFRELERRREFGPGRGSVMGRALLSGQPVQIEDVLADPEYTFTDAQQSTGFRTVLAIPLHGDSSPFGVLGLWRKRVAPFSEAEINLLKTFADQAAIAISNVRLFETVQEQRTELARFAPQVAGLLSTPGGAELLAGHRREITALFCDMRGFTAFAETAEPEDLFSVLREYHGAVGELAVAHGGMVEHFAGDGLMVFFNDPTPISDHPLAALRTAIAIRERFQTLAAGWRKRGHGLGLGMGLAVGYATLGRIGFEGRYDYAGVGVVINLASRLSSAAAADEILVNQKLHAAVEDVVVAEPVENLDLKGFTHAVLAYRVTGLREPAAS